HVARLQLQLPDDSPRIRVPPEHRDLPRSLRLAERGERRERARLARRRGPRVGGGALARARALRDHGAPRRHQARGRARAGRVRRGLVPGAQPGAPARGAGPARGGGARLTGTYRELELAFSPGATGGITALEILNILEQFPKSAVGWKTPGGLNLRAHAVRRAFADRFEHLGDPSMIQAPWERLASKQYAREVAAELRRRPKPGSGRTDPTLGAVAAGGDCTTHIGVIDRQ